MNEKTVVAVFGYAGDAHQIRMMLPYYLHHRRPVIILSPMDSPITSKEVPIRLQVHYNRPGQATPVEPPPVYFQQAGKRAYIGPDSLTRQAAQMQLMINQFRDEWFLLNDSDSVVLSPELPLYIYENPEIVWSNIVNDATVHPMEERLKVVATYDYPQLAFQPPYFIHRTAIQKLINVAPSVPPDPRTPFIDWCMMAWSVRAGLQYRGFPDGCSCPTNDANPSSIAAVSNAVQNEGKIFIHSIKTPHVLQRLAFDRLRYKKTHGLK